MRSETAYLVVKSYRTYLLLHECISTKLEISFGTQLRHVERYKSYVVDAVVLVDGVESVEQKCNFAWFSFNPKYL